MGYSGLIYAAIVACWAAVLVPRWIRRNEEVERAREEDAARGVRILERRDGPGRHSRTVSSPPSLTTAAGPRAHPLRSDQTAQAGTGRPRAAGLGAPPQMKGDAADPLESADEPEVDESFGTAARRRRQVLVVLVLVLGVVGAGAVVGRLAPSTVVAPALLLAGFLVLAHRAAVVETRRRARLRQLRQRAVRDETGDEARQDAAAVSATGKRIAVLDLPEPAVPPDPNAWEPVPVPLPTYLTKAKAESPAARKIDLSSAGAWTSGRLNPASSIALPPLPADEVRRPRAGGDEFPEQQRAVGE